MSDAEVMQSTDHEGVSFSAIDIIIVVVVVVHDVCSCSSPDPWMEKVCSCLLVCMITCIGWYLSCSQFFESVYSLYSFCHSDSVPPN